MFYAVCIRNSFHATVKVIFVTLSFKCTVRPVAGPPADNWRHFLRFWAPCRYRRCKNRPAPFLGQMSFKATKPGLVSALYLSML